MLRLSLSSTMCGVVGGVLMSGRYGYAGAQGGGTRNGALAAAAGTHLNSRLKWMSSQRKAKK